MGSTVYFAHNEGLQDDFGINKEYKFVLVISTIILITHSVFSMGPVLNHTMLDINCHYLDPGIIFIVAMMVIIGIMVTWPALRTFKGKHEGAGLTRLSVEVS